MDFLETLRRLNATGTEFIIVGGVAARLYGSTRLTHDVDIIPRLSPKTWGGLIDLIWNTGARPRIPESRQSIQDVSNIETWIAEKGMLALTFRTPDGTFEIDLLVGESDRFDELRTNARQVQVGSETFFVAGLDDLIEMKERAGRPQDLLDIQQLRALKERTTSEPNE